MFHKAGEFAFIEQWKVARPHYSVWRTVRYGAVVVPITLVCAIPLGVAVAARAALLALGITAAR